MAHFRATTRKNLQNGNKNWNIRSGHSDGIVICLGFLGRGREIWTKQKARHGKLWRDLGQRRSVSICFGRGQKSRPKQKAWSAKWLQALAWNYKTWKNPVISMVCKPLARGFILYSTRNHVYLCDHIPQAIFSNHIL